MPSPWLMRELREQAAKDAALRFDNLFAFAAPVTWARAAFPSERLVRRSYHACGCIIITDEHGNVLCGVACLHRPEHRADITEPDDD